jgi:hypothetical protein
MKKLLVYNAFLLVSLLAFYNIAGFDTTEFLFLASLLFVFQASHFLDYWLMWLGILGIEIAVSLAIARLYFFGKIHYTNRSKNLQQARLLLQQKDYEGFLFFIEPYTQNSTLYEKLQQNLHENKTDDIFGQRCEVFLNAIERNEKIEIPI